MENRNTPEKQQRIRVIGLDVSVGGHETAIEKIFELVKQKNGSYVCLSNVHMVMESYDDGETGVKINNADLILPDGMPIVWMQKLRGAKNAERVRGIDLMIALCDFAEKNKLKIGFYGGRQKVIENILARARRDFPKLNIAYAFSPPFRPLTGAEDAEVIENIKKSGVQILFVSLGCPKQEYWMVEHKDKLTAVMLGVGAAFDFYAGNINESPRWMGNLGLEWLYRLFQEPKRLWRRYLILNPRFMWLAAMQLTGARKFDFSKPESDGKKQLKPL